MSLAINNDSLVDTIYDFLSKKIDWENFEELKTYYEGIFNNYRTGDALKVSPIKYVIDFEYHLKIAIRNALLLGIDLISKPINILDLGAGAGYFLFVCKQLGHYTLGLDVNPETAYADSPNKELLPFYRDLFNLLNLKRIEWNINSFDPLPYLDKKFDVITAFYICFNNHKREIVWDVEEWDFFLKDVSQYLNNDGFVFLRLNREPDGTYYTDRLLQFFKSKGRLISNNEIIIPAVKIL